MGNAIWALLAVALVLLAGTAGTGIVAGAGTSAGVSPHALAPVDDLSCRLTVASYTLQNESAPEHEELCDQLLEAQQEAGAETARLSREISELYQAVVDRQTELTAICPQDLSIIACTASAVDDARGEYADEIARLTTERDASQERWSALMEERSRCVEAYYAGEEYEVDPAIAALLVDPAPLPTATRPVLRGEVSVTVGGPEDVSQDEPSSPVDDEQAVPASPDESGTPPAGGENQGETEAGDGAVSISPEAAAGGTGAAIVAYNVVQIGRRRLGQRTVSEQRAAADRARSETSSTVGTVAEAVGGVVSDVESALEVGEGVGDVTALSRTGRQASGGRPNRLPDPPSSKAYITASGVRKVTAKLKFLGPVGRVLDATRIGSAWAEEGRVGDKTLTTTGDVVGGMAGATAGAWAGATLGSLAGPVGTIVGGITGGIIGGMGGGNIGEGLVKGALDFAK